MKFLHYIIQHNTYFRLHLSLLLSLQGEDTEGTRCDISGTGEKPRPISSSPEKEDYHTTNNAS